MADEIASYRSGQAHVPARFARWHLRGAGLDALSCETVDTAQPGPDEILVRHDACGICFSDIKIITLGDEHPRLQGRDMQYHPVVMGHEVALTVVGVGSNRRDRFRVGQRYIVQADVYYGGANVAYGYQLSGGFAQFGIVGKEVLDGDEGCYLIPIKESTGYVEAALVEPWACVVAAYDYDNYRPGPLPGGAMLVVGASQVEEREIRSTLVAGGEPSRFRTVDSGFTGFSELRQSETNGRGFDDIVVFGAKSASQIAEIAVALAPKGTLLAIGPREIAGEAGVDVGRIHYEHQLFIGAESIQTAAGAYTANNRRDLKPGGVAWFVGAGGPMGQMHIQRAAMLDQPPRRIVVSDISELRLSRIRARFGKLMVDRNIELISLNPADGADPAQFAPYDDIVALVPNAGVVSDSIKLLADFGVYNIFAGVAKGVTAQLKVGEILAKNQRLIGTSGSSIADLRKTLDFVESGRLSTNASLAAIGGMSALRDGLAAVKAGRFPGKTVIFPAIDGLALTPLDNLHACLPHVHAKLLGGSFWTNEAEEELFHEFLRQ